MGAGAANVVLILGDIGEMREKAKSANDLQRFLGRQTVEYAFEIAARADIFVAAEANGVLANVFDDLEDPLAVLLAHRVAEDPAEQANIFAQRPVFVFGLTR
jgi:hypothetical protein